jgi:hypothetical protein
MNGTQPSSLTPHRGTLILVLGILGLVLLCGPCGLVAWILGNGDLKKIDAGQMDPSGRGTTNAGRICGMISTILWILGVLFYVAIFVLAIVGGAARHH